MKKLIKLINNERLNSKVASQKAYVECSGEAIDYYLGIGDNYAACSSHAYDKCYRVDLAACIQGAHDYCESFQYDTEACFGPGQIDGNPNL